jgi:hypothetical protein
MIGFSCTGENTKVGSEYLIKLTLSKPEKHDRDCCSESDSKNVGLIWLLN